MKISKNRFHEKKTSFISKRKYLITTFNQMKIHSKFRFQIKHPSCRVIYANITDGKENLFILTRIAKILLCIFIHREKIRHKYL